MVCVVNMDAAADMADTPQMQRDLISVPKSYYSV